MKPEFYILWMKDRHGNYQYIRDIESRALAMDHARGVAEEFQTDVKITRSDGDFDYVYQINYRGMRA